MHFPQLARKCTKARFQNMVAILIGGSNFVLVDFAMKMLISAQFRGERPINSLSYLHDQSQSKSYASSPALMSELDSTAVLSFSAIRVLNPGRAPTPPVLTVWTDIPGLSPTITRALHHRRS